MKKITACALAGLIALQGLSGTAIAADSGVIRVGSAVVSAGETFSLPIQLEQNPGLAALSLNLSYDADMLELLGTEDGKILGSSTYLPGNDLTLNPYTMLWDDLAETNNTGTGTVVTLQFRALEGAVGSTAVSASVFQPSTYNIDLEDVAFETFSGTVSIAPDENTAAITVDTVTASPGSIAEVPVRIRSNPGIAALTLNISYDDTQLKLLGADDGKILGTSTFLAGNDMTMIPYTLMWDDLSDTNNTGNGIAAVLKFEVLAESGLAPVNVEVYQPSTYNIDLEEVTFAAVGGGVKIGAAETGTTPATTETTSTTETATSVSRTPNPDCDPRFVGEWMLWQEYQDGKLLVDNGAALPDGNGHFKRIVLFEDGTGKGYEAYRWPDMEEADFEMMAQNPYWNYKWTSTGDTVTLSLYLVMPDDPDAIDPTAFCGDSKLQYKDGLLHESDVAEDGSKMERTYKKSGASDVTGTQTTATTTDTTRTTTNTTRTTTETTYTTTNTTRTTTDTTRTTTDTASTATETTTSVSRTQNPDCDPRFVGEWMLWQEYQDGKLLVDNGAALPDGNGHFKRIVLFEDGTGKGYEAYRWPDMEEADFEMMAQNPYWNYKWTSTGDTVTLSLYLVMPDDPDAIDPTAFCGDSKLQYKDGLLHESDVAEDGSKMERTYKKSGASDVTGTQTTATATDTTRTTTNTTRTSSDTTQTTTETPPSDGTRVLEYDLSKIAPDDLSHVCYIYSGDGSGDALIKDDATAARIIAVKWTIHCPEDGDGQWRGGSMVINMNSNGNGGYNSEMWEVNGSDPDRYAAVPIGNSLYTLTREISGFQPGADNWLNVGWSVYSSSGEAELVRLQVILRDDGSTDTTYTTTDTTRTTTETTHTTTETTRTTTDTTYTTTDTTDSTTETTVTTTEITVPDGAGVIAVDTVHAAAGSTVEVPIRIRSNPGIAALSLILSYDPAQLRLVGVTDQKLLGTSDFIPGKDLTAIPYNMNWDDLSETNNTQEGIVAVLKFEVLAESGTAAVGIRLNQASTYNIDLKDVPFAVISGAVQIGGSDILMGDINCDGTVTPDDLILLMRFIAEAPGTSVPEAGLDAADMNADGLITLMDAAAVSAMLKP